MRGIKQGAVVSLIFACGGFIIVGCAGEGPRPMEEMTRAHTLIEQTDKDGNAQRYAAADLQRAHDEFADATRADGAGQFTEARNFAEAASVDANLAAARGAAGEAKRSASEVTQGNATLRSESNRAVENSVNTAPPPASPN
jgi:Domain of unknown function (DUF4398)